MGKRKRTEETENNEEKPPVGKAKARQYLNQPQNTHSIVKTHTFYS